MMLMIRIVFCAAALAAFVTDPAAAQAPNINLMPDVKSKTPEEKERDAQVDKAYRESLRKIPDAKGTADPWGEVRGAEAGKPAAKPKTVEPKTVQPKPVQPKRAKADVPAN